MIKTVLLIALGLGLCCANEKIVCDEKSEEKLDDIVLDLSLFHPDNKHPANVDDHTAWCSKNRKHLKWVRTYMDECLSGTFTHDVMTASNKDFDGLLKKYCDSPNLTQQFLSWSKCANKAKNYTVDCIQSFTVHMEKMAKAEVADPDRMQLVCCNHYTFDKCAEEAFKKPGPEVCPEEARKGLESLIDDIMSGSNDQICGDFKADSDKCEALYKKYKSLDDTKIEKPHKTPLFAFIKLMANKPKAVEKSSSAESADRPADRPAERPADERPAEVPAV